MKRLLALLIWSCCLSAQASEPCRPDSAPTDADPDVAAWRARAQWVAVGRIVELKHDLQPYANCMLDDRSACAKFNQARLTLVVDRMEKGKRPADGKLRLTPQYCGRHIPLDFDVSRRYRFFGDDDQFFQTFQALER